MKLDAETRLFVTISTAFALFFGTSISAIAANSHSAKSPISKKTVVRSQKKRLQSAKGENWTQETPFISETHQSAKLPPNTEKKQAAQRTDAITYPNSQSIQNAGNAEHQKYETDIQKALGGAWTESQKKPPSGNGYAIGNTRVEMSYGKENDRAGERRDFLTEANGNRQPSTNPRMIESNTDRDVWHLGFGYDKGKHHFNTSVDYLQMRDEKDGSSTSNEDPAEMKTITFGYSHDVSENTSLYGAFSHTEYDQDKLPNSSKNGDDSINQFSVGIKHRF